MKQPKFVETLLGEAERYNGKAQEHAMSALRRSEDGRTITALDARLIRDHEVRAETYKAAARIVEGGEA